MADFNYNKKTTLLHSLKQESPLLNLYLQVSYFCTIQHEKNLHAQRIRSVYTHMLAAGQECKNMPLRAINSVTCLYQINKKAVSFKLKL